MYRRSADGDKASITAFAESLRALRDGATGGGHGCDGSCGRDSRRRSPFGDPAQLIVALRACRLDLKATVRFPAADVAFLLFEVWLYRARYRGESTNDHSELRGSMQKRRLEMWAMAGVLAIALNVLNPESSAAQPVRGTQTPKAIVLAFYKVMAQDFKPAEAFAQYMSSDFVEHAADSAGGRMQSSIDFLTAAAKQSPPAKFEIVRTIAEGDLVFLHVRVTVGLPTPVALGEIFRVQGGKIVEHWDIAQPVPEHPINPNSPF